MKYIIKDEEGNNRYKIYPYENGLCWCIDEYVLTEPRDKSKKPYWRWKFTEKYPSTLYRAFEVVEELLRIKDESAPKDIRELKRTLTKHHNQLMKAIKEGK